MDGGHELLKVVGQQQEHPVLFKRGMGITLDESLNACEYLAAGGNHKIIFGLRGVKTNLRPPDLTSNRRRGRGGVAQAETA